MTDRPLPTRAPRFARGALLLFLASALLALVNLSQANILRLDRAIARADRAIAALQADEAAAHLAAATAAKVEWRRLMDEAAGIMRNADQQLIEARAVERRWRALYTTQRQIVALCGDGAYLTRAPSRLRVP